MCYEREDRKVYLAQHCRMLLEAHMLDIHRTACQDSVDSVVERETMVARARECVRVL